MNCGAENCTGKHSSTYKAEEICPAVIDRIRVRERERMRLKRQDPEYHAKELAQQRAYNISEFNRARKREIYANMSGLEYNRLLLRHRRTKALRRLATKQRED